MAKTPDKTGEIDLNPSLLLEKLDSWLDGAMRLLPNMVVAIVVFIIFYIVASLIKRLVINRLTNRGRDNLGEILGGFIKSALVVMGALFCATIVVPTLNLGDLIAGLGVGSVAIGFAFKDILQNWLAGLLILLRQPFEIGDQIRVGEYEGTVQKIETRATIIKTYNGQKVVVPNSEIYTSAVLVKTAYRVSRSQYDIGIGYGDNIDTACDVIIKTLQGIDGVEQDPAPEALPWELAASWVTIRARWWTDSQRGDIVANKAAVILKVKQALDDAKIDMPYETKVHLLHDQTEARDGIPGQQREGWPAEADKKVQARWLAEKDLQQNDSNNKAGT